MLEIGENLANVISVVAVAVTTISVLWMCTR